MKNFTDTVESLWQVLVVGVLLGAGLPTLFALGIRLIADGPVQDDGTVDKAHPLARVAGWICVVAVGIAILLGIAFVMKDFLANDFDIHLF